MLLDLHLLLDFFVGIHSASDLIVWLRRIGTVVMLRVVFHELQKMGVVLLVHFFNFVGHSEAQVPITSQFDLAEIVLVQRFLLRDYTNCF